MTNVLLIEDDARVADFVRRGLIAEGYTVDLASSGAQGLAKAAGGEHALIILDRMLPGGVDGSDICQKLRAGDWSGGILMLTARDAVRDRVDGLRAGADDYLTKPFAFDELLARLEALSRRAARGEKRHDEHGTAAILTVGEFVLDPQARRVSRAGQPIELTAREFDLLRYLLENAGKVVSRARILSAVWNYTFDPTTKVVDVYVRYLRQKVDREGETSVIRAVRGIGYVFDEAASGGAADDSAALGGTPNS